MIYKKIPMLKINFYLRGSDKAKPDTMCSIYFQLEIEGVPRDTPCSTKLRIPKKYWKNQGAVREYIWSEPINQRLEQITRSFKDIFTCLNLQGQTIKYHHLREQYDAKNFKPKVKQPILFFDVFDKMLENRIKFNKISEGTIRNYAVRRFNLEKFFKDIELPNPKISEIKYCHIEKLLIYFANGWGNEHRNKHAQAINQTLDFALKKELITFNPIGKLILPSDEPQPPKYLTKNLRQQIQSLQIDSLGKIRDISIFLWSTGLSYTDYLSLNSSHILSTDEGHWIKKKRNKSQIYSLIPILNSTAAIIEKYGEIEKLPRPNISDFNKGLKYLGEFSGINKKTVGFNLSSSVFRETFCSMMENEYMIEERTVMFMMGHKSRKQLNQYSHVMPSRMMHELKKTDIKIFSINKKAS